MLNREIKGLSGAPSTVVWDTAVEVTDVLFTWKGKGHGGGAPRPAQARSEGTSAAERAGPPMSSPACGKENVELAIGAATGAPGTILNEPRESWDRAVGPVAGIRGSGSLRNRPSLLATAQCPRSARKETGRRSNAIQVRSLNGMAGRSQRPSASGGEAVGTQPEQE